MKRFFWFHVLSSTSYCLISGHLLLLWIGPRYAPRNNRKIRTSSFLCFHQRHLIKLTGSSEQMALKWFVHCFITLCVQFHCSIKYHLGMIQERKPSIMLVHRKPFLVTTRIPSVLQCGCRSKLKYRVSLPHFLFCVPGYICSSSFTLSKSERLKQGLRKAGCASRWLTLTICW